MLKSPGELVTREDLIKRLWPPGVFVDFDQSLNRAVARLREALGDSAEHPRLIETLPRKGYRFIGPISEQDPKFPPHSRELPPPSPGSSPPQSVPPKLRLFPYWLVVVAIGVACLVFFLWQQKRKNTQPALQAIAVLPLENLTGDPSQEYLSDGITDEMITALARVSGLRVISRTSAMQYKRTRKPIPEIARELKVGAVVEGSLQRSGDQLRMRVQLIRAETDQHLWAGEYDRKLNDVFALENDVARDIAVHTRFQVNYTKAERLTPIHPIDPQAFQDYLQGQHYWALREKEGLAKALESFQRAIQEDPNDARSYAGLAHWYLVLPFLTEMSPHDAFEKAKTATRAALILDPSVPEAHLANAELLMYADWKFSAAEEEFRRTIELNPNNSTAHQWYGELLSMLGRHDEAVRQENSALALDPLSVVVHHEAGGILRDAGRFEEALAEYREALKLNPRFKVAHTEMSWVFRRQGKILESIRALRRGAEGVARDYKLDPAMIREINNLETAYTQGGRTGYLRQCLKVHSYQPRPSFYVARDYAQLGQRDAAIAELTRSFYNRDTETLWMLIDPELNPLRSDRRFQALISAVGFPQH